MTLYVYILQLVLELCTAVNTVIEETGYLIVEHPVVDKIVTQRITHGMVTLKLYRSSTKPSFCRDNGSRVLKSVVELA